MNMYTDHLFSRNLRCAFQVLNDSTLSETLFQTNAHAVNNYTQVPGTIQLQKSWMWSIFCLECCLLQLTLSALTASLTIAWWWKLMTFLCTSLYTMTHKERLIFFAGPASEPGVFLFLLVLAVGGPRSADDETIAKGPLGFWLGTRSRRGMQRLEKRKKTKCHSPLFCFFPNFYPEERLCAVGWKSVQFTLYRTRVFTLTQPVSR